MRTELDHAIVEAMSTYGGSFAKALANAAQHADVINYARLVAAFPDIWHQYAGMITPIDKEDTL